MARVALNLKIKNKLSSMSSTTRYKMSKAMREIINEFLEIRPCSNVFLQKKLKRQYFATFK